MPSLLLRNLLFTILQPGIVAGLIPYLLVKDQLKTTLSSPFHFYQWIAFVIIIIGLAILFYCIYHFAKYGHGTLSPADPTKQLVTKGLYRYSRNPMYLGVLLVLLGETIFMRSLMLGAYLFLITILFLLYVVYFEERRLSKSFGDDYTNYKKKVKRWI